MGEVILVQRPIASGSFNEDTDSSLINCYAGSKVEQAATVKLKAALISRCQRDRVQSQIVNALSDCGSKSDPLVPSTDLLLNLESGLLLLPRYHEFL